MHKVIAALGLAVAVPVALAAPALAKPPAPSTPSVFSSLRQHEGFRAEVTYTCTDPKDEEGTINVFLQQPVKAGASAVITIGTAREEAKCDGDERDDTLKIRVAPGALRADRTVQVYTTLVVNGKQVAKHTSSAVAVSVDSPQPTASPTSTGSATPSASATPSTSGSPATAHPSASATPSASGSPETESSSPSATPSGSASASASSSPSPTATS